ncbi:MAG: rsmG, partial [Marmoricola sp.]|nr:rsmG [Marmoricola sp.]
TWSCSPRRDPGDRFVNDHVSRETPPAPTSAQGVFSHALPKAEEFADLLVREATVRGLIGPREVPRIWERHLLNCAVVTDLIAPGSTVCDVGSGAGLPGIVLAIRRPDLQVTLVEPLLRRTTFLDLAVSTMELTNVHVRRGRAEELHGDQAWAEGFDVVTSRAVAPMDRLSPWSLPLVRRGGLFLAMKGSSAPDELTSAASIIGRLGGSGARIESVGAEWLTPPVTVVRVEKTGDMR